VGRGIEGISEADLDGLGTVDRVLTPTAVSERSN
jgi:hypothetical protein